MGFGGDVVTPAPAPVATAPVKEGPTEAQKTKKQLQKDYGYAMELVTSGATNFKEDNTLSSGSLLALGNNLGV